jgi:hypothetical protein
LRRARLNTDEAQAEIAFFERLKGELEAFRGAVVDFSNGKEKEATVVKSTKSFEQGVREWWTKGHEKICQNAFEMAMFTTAVGICSLAGSGGKAAVIISGTLVGGKRIADVLKSVKKLW